MVIKHCIVGRIVVDTPTFFIAKFVADVASQKKSVRGSVAFKRVRYRWTTLKHFEINNGFLPAKRTAH